MLVSTDPFDRWPLLTVDLKFFFWTFPRWGLLLLTGPHGSPVRMLVRRVPVCDPQRRRWRNERTSFRFRLASQLAVAVLQLEFVGPNRVKWGWLKNYTKTSVLRCSNFRSSSDVLPPFIRIAEEGKTRTTIRSVCASHKNRSCPRATRSSLLKLRAKL
jgi:hypothetical protein